MNYHDYVFLLYMSKYYDHTIFNRILKEAERGMSLAQRKKARDTIKEVKKPKRPRAVMLIYIIFKRTRAHSHVDELGHILGEELKDLPRKEIEKAYKELKRLMEELGLPELEVNKNAVRNVYKFID